MQKNRFSKLSISIKSRGRFNVEKKSNLKKINKNKSWDEINEKIKDILNDN